MEFTLFCWNCDDNETVHPTETDGWVCATCGTSIDMDLDENKQTMQAWSEDEKDMARIAREWDAFDRE